MLERFGDVFYWIGIIVAAMVVLAGVGVVVYLQDDAIGAYFGGGIALTGLIPYLVGRACRFALADRF
jgi:hypothetical protein